MPPALAARPYNLSNSFGLAGPPSSVVYDAAGRRQGGYMGYGPTVTRPNPRLTNQILELLRGASAAGPVHFLPFHGLTAETPEQRRDYRHMLRNPYLKAAVITNVLQVASLPYQVQPSKWGGPYAEESAANIDWTLENVEGGFAEVVWDVLIGGMLAGHSVTEPRYNLAHYGPQQGYVVTDTFKARDDLTYRMDVDAYLNVTALQAVTFNYGEFFDPQDFVVFAHNKIYDNPLGMSDLRSVWAAVRGFDMITRLELIGLDKFALPFVKATYSAAEHRASLEEALSVARDNGYLLVPQGTEVEMLNLLSAGSLDAFDKAKESKAKEIAIGISGAYLHMLTSGTPNDRGDSGVQKSTSELIPWWLSQRVCNALNHQWVPRQSRWNYGLDCALPRITMGGVNVTEMLNDLELDEGLLGLGVDLSVEDRRAYYGRTAPADPRDSLIARKALVSMIGTQPPGGDNGPGAGGGDGNGGRGDGPGGGGSDTGGTGLAFADEHWRDQPRDEAGRWAEEQSTRLTAITSEGLLAGAGALYSDQARALESAGHAAEALAGHDPAAYRTAVLAHVGHQLPAWEAAWEEVSAKMRAAGADDATISRFEGMRQRVGASVAKAHARLTEALDALAAHPAAEPPEPDVPDEPDDDAPPEEWAAYKAAQTQHDRWETALDRWSDRGDLLVDRATEQRERFRKLIEAADEGLSRYAYEWADRELGRLDFADYQESKHPRGQPHNRGQFASAPGHARAGATHTRLPPLQGPSKKPTTYLPVGSGLKPARDLPASLRGPAKAADPLAGVTAALEAQFGKGSVSDVSKGLPAAGSKAPATVPPPKTREQVLRDVIGQNKRDLAKLEGSSDQEASFDRVRLQHEIALAEAELSGQEPPGRLGETPALGEPTPEERRAAADDMATAAEALTTLARQLKAAGVAPGHGAALAAAQARLSEAADKLNAVLARVRLTEREPLPFADDADGHWITIGGTKGGDGKRHGGSPVFIRNGRIEKGAPGLAGRHVGNLKEEPKGRKAQQAAADSGWASEAKKSGVHPDDLHTLAGEIQEHDRHLTDERAEVVRAAHHRSREKGFTDLRTAALNEYHGRGDADALRGLDEIATDLATAYPHHFAGHHDPVQRLHDMVLEGVPKRMSRDDAYRQALEHLAAHGPHARNRRHQVSEEPIPFADQSRGQPDNAGKFGPGGYGKKAKPAGKGRKAAAQGGQVQANPGAAALQALMAAEFGNTTSSGDESSTGQNDAMTDAEGKPLKAGTFNYVWLAQLAKQVDRELIEEATALEPGDEPSPPIVAVEGGRLEIVDGFHRVAGWAKWAQGNGRSLDGVQVDVIVADDEDDIAAAAEPGPQQKAAIRRIEAKAHHLTEEGRPDDA